MFHTSYIIIRGVFLSNKDNNYFMFMGVVLVLVLISGCSNSSTQNTANISGGENMNSNNISISTNNSDSVKLSRLQNVFMTTSDDVKIAGTYFPNNNSEKGLVLLHQFSLDKSSYYKWAPEFQKTHNVLAIDFRGHGDSDLDYTKFTDKDFIYMQKDVDAAFKFLESKGIAAQNISIIGASIGANTAQNYASDNLHDKLVLLSPGLNFKGIFLNMKDNSALVIASHEDSYSFETTLKMQAQSPNSRFISLDNRGHGTNMLNGVLVNEIHNFLLH